MQCLNCQFDNPPGMKFCGQCGTQLAQLCPRCGAENQPTFKFCGQCGAALTVPQPSGPDTAGDLDQSSQRHEAQRQGYTPPHLAEKILRSRSALEGERRHVTVLFADLTGFTPLAEKLDPEEVHQIIDHCFELITAEVHRFEGTINQYTGDGVMALFGAPIAHEDSPRRAVHAALGIHTRYGRTVRSCRHSAVWPCRCAWGSTPGWWSWAKSVTTCAWTTPPWGTPPIWRLACSRWPARAVYW